MSKNKITIFHVILIILSLSISQVAPRPDKYTKSYCLVKPYKHDDEFMYASRHTDPNHNNDRLIYINTPSLSNTLGMDSLKWIFEPVEWINDNSSYYIRNAKYNDEWLCTSHNRNDMFKTKRLVHLKNLNRESLITNKNCIWKLDELERGTSKFNVWNLNYYEPLYVTSLFIPLNTRGKNIYTYYKPPDSNQFVWYIYCSKAYSFKWKKSQQFY